MANVVAIIQDDRVRGQVETYLTQLGMEDLRFATFKTHQEFTAIYWRDRRKKVEEVINPDEKTAEADDVDLKHFSEVHLLIFALDSIGEKSGPWIEKLKTNMKRMKHWPEKGPTRLVMLKYEEDGISKLDTMHPLLDDLIFLPLDRLVFLQKIQILLALPKRVKPEYLFNQEVKQNIEISKISKMDRLSDVGLAIRNPIPLRKGLPGHFYINLPGDKSRLELRGKVFRSEPHPEYPGQYLVYFSYFGLNKTDLSKIRQSLSKSPRYQSLYSDDKSLFRFRPDDLFLDETDSKVFGVAVIDTDELVANNLAAALKKDMDRLKVVTETSYQMFLNKYLDAGTTSDRSPLKPTDPVDIFQSPMTLTVAAEGAKTLNVSPSPGTGDFFLGHPALDLFASPDKFLTLFADKGSRLVYEETLQLVAKGVRQVEKILAVADTQNSRRALTFTFKRGATEHLVSVQVTPASLADIVDKVNADAQQKEIEVFVMDSAFVPEEPSAWLESLRTRAANSGLVRDPKMLKFFVTADTDARASGPLLLNPDILGLLVKPVDPRQMQFLLSEFLPNKHTVYQFDNLGWSQPNLAVHVSKATVLEALSEFGATLKSRQPLAPGTMIFLRKSIFENAPNACLSSRVYACEPHPSEKDSYQVYVSYFGINDQFLKFARTWIRENYAQQKEREAGG